MQSASRYHLVKAFRADGGSLMHLPNSQSNETFTGLHLQARIFVNDYFSTDLRPKVLPNSCCLCSKAEVFFIKSENKH